MTRKLLVAISIAVLAVAAAGCGGSDESSSTTEAAPASEWANGFCTAVSTWKTDVTSIGEQFKDLSSFSEEGLKSAAGDVKDATDQLVEDLRALGAPDTESGQEVKNSIDDLANTLDTEMESLQTTVDETSGITEIPGAVQDAATSLSAMYKALSETLSAIGDADVKNELQDALESSPECDGLTS